jgi:hypothetical protein
VGGGEGEKSDKEKEEREKERNEKEKREGEKGKREMEKPLTSRSPRSKTASGSDRSEK